ncbi:hypothetical protein SAMN05216235_1811 [Salinicoccus halodurans]|uniref:Uncharacterized protein n=2 Tax=Salinicoccus halodurans TaxID=407035 RepID=A0AA94KWG5_9STAP|nr:hypothetical protein SAMN05216235_1811 [Salinicoccus halodurans]
MVYLAFFKYLFWDNKHMDLRYTENKYDAKPTITKVYDDGPEVDLEAVNKKYRDDLRDAQRSINGNRLVMLIFYMVFVFLPAILISVFQNNILLLGSIFVFTIFVYFIVETVNQVEINKLLYKMDDYLGGH